MLVAKYGAAGGFTFGVGDALKSYLRDATSLGLGWSHEWPIISTMLERNRSATFSEKEDSGACIWDMQRRPVGILTAGNGWNRSNDVTYAQPLERLLTDIQDHGFDVSLV